MTSRNNVIHEKQQFVNVISFQNLSSPIHFGTEYCMKKLDIKKSITSILREEYKAGRADNIR